MVPGKFLYPKSLNNKNLGECNLFGLRETL